MRRIVHVSPYAMDTVSGITRMIVNLGSHLSPTLYQLRVCSPADGPTTSGIRSDNIPLRLPTARNWELAARTLFRLVRRRATFDLIHCHQVHIQTIVALIVARVLGKPGVITCHVRVPSSGPRNRRIDDLKAWIALRMAAQAVAVSGRVRDDFPRNHWIIIPNGVDVRRPPAGGDRRGGTTLEPGSIEIVFVGRVTRTKGVFTLLEALHLLVDTLKVVRLTTYGPIDSPMEYETAKRRLGVERLVTDRGFTSTWREQVQAGQVFCIPSLYEGLPLSMLEAMAEGLPVVATPVGGIPDIVTPYRTGLLVSVNDPKRLAEALEWLSAHAEERIAMGEEARRVVEGKFRADQMALAYSRLYSDLLTRT